MQQPVRRARGIRLALSLCVAVLFASPCWAACIDTYPDSQVTQRLAKEAYAACTLEKMGADYAEILREEARLLGWLRPAYERALAKDTTLGKQAVLNRLEEFDVRVKELSALADGIGGGAKAGNKSEKGKGAGEVPSAPKLIQKGRETSELLRSRIVHARESLEPQESDQYCKLDFHFRLGEGLNALMRKCMK